MRRFLQRGFIATAALMVLLLAGSMPAPSVAQSIPHAVSCSLSLTGQQAWLSGTRHVCGAVEVETRMRSQRIDNPYPGGVYTVWIFYYDMRARLRSTGGSVLVAKVDVANSPQCSFNVGAAWSWRECAANAYEPAPPRMTLSSVVLMY